MCVTIDFFLLFLFSGIHVAQNFYLSEVFSYYGKERKGNVCLLCQNHSNNFTYVVLFNLQNKSETSFTISI